MSYFYWRFNHVDDHIFTLAKTLKTKLNGAVRADQVLVLYLILGLIAAAK